MPHKEPPDESSEGALDDSGVSNDADATDIDGDSTAQGAPSST